MVKEKFIITCCLFCLLAFRCVAQPYPLQVNTTIIPPVNPFISQLIESPENNLSAIITTVIPGGNFRIKLAGTISRISPAPISIGVSADFRPAFPLTIGTTQPILILNKSMVENAFGNVTQSNLVITGTTFDALKQDFNVKLPEGEYKICLVAYDYDAQGFSKPLSDPNGGCAFFNICYSAAPPQITSPVNEYANPTGVTVISSNSPITFTWTPPVAACGLTFPGLTYNLELFNLYAGQTATDAVIAPDIFLKTGLAAPVFVLDTLLYPGVLQIGNQYVVRVQAVIPANNNGLVIDNNGYSRPLPFQFDSISAAPPRRRARADRVDPVPVCSGIAYLDADTMHKFTTDKLLETDVNIGSFLLHIDTITHAAASEDDSFAGNGYITWTPFGLHPLKLAVIFDNLKIAKDSPAVAVNGAKYHVYGGTAITSDTANIGQHAEATNPDGSYTDDGVAALNDFLDNNQSHIIGSAPLGLITCPLGMKKTVLGDSITLAITSVVFWDSGTNMSVMLNLPFNTDMDGWLSLAGSNFCLTPTGFSFQKAVLYLPAAHQIPTFDGYTFTFRPANFSTTEEVDTAAGDSGTFASWDKTGVLFVQISATLAIPKSVLTAVDSAGKVDTLHDVVASFYFRLDSNWHNWIAGGSISPFQMPWAHSFSVMADSIYYDHDSTHNVPGMKAPPNYKDDIKGFSGLYIPKFQLMFPKGFGIDNDTSDRMRIDARDFMFELPGAKISAFVDGYNIVNLDSGNLDGWRFSVDTLTIQVLQNIPDSLYLSGKVQLPISNDTLFYTGDITPDKNLDLTVRPDSGFHVDIWKTKLIFDTGCVFSIGSDDKGFYAGALINATVTLDDTITGIPLNIKGVHCKGLYIGNRDPTSQTQGFTFNKGDWSFASPQHDIGGFSLSLDTVYNYLQPHGNNWDVGLTFVVHVGILDTVLDATSSFNLYGTIDNVPSGTAIPSKVMTPEDAVHLTLNSFQIDTADLGPVSIKGGVSFTHGDPTWGNGFIGNLAASFEPAGVGIAAIGMFGKIVNSTDTMTYWYVDANLSFPPIPVGALLSLNGFGGGAYYNLMIDTSKQGKPLPAANTFPTSSTPANSLAAGANLSGVVYRPQIKNFGLLATTLWQATGAATEFNGELTLGVSWGSDETFTLDGTFYFMDYDYPKDHKTAVISDTLHARLDLTNKYFSFISTTTINDPPITGSVPIDILDNWGVTPTQWHMHIGDPYTPSKRAKINFLGDDGLVGSALDGEVQWNFGLGATAYVAAGNDFKSDSLPPLPAAVDSALGAGLDTRFNDVSAFGSGGQTTPATAGLMMGADVYGHADVIVQPLYMNDSLEAGFDMMLKHSSSPCNGEGNTVGIDGWYAKGQLYAYLSGDAGIYVDCWFVSGEFSLMSVTVAALLTAGLPNPTGGEGEVHINGSVLDGYITVSTSLNFSFGSACVVNANPLNLGSLISSAGPQGSAVDVYSNVHATTSIATNKEFDVYIAQSQRMPNNGPENARYQFTVSKFTLTDSRGNVVSSAFQTPDGYTSTLTQNTVLQGLQTYTAKISVSIAEFDPNTQQFTFPYDYVAGHATDTLLHIDSIWTFTTGPAPGFLPESEVVQAIPVNMQRYFLPGSFPAGKIVANKFDANNINLSPGMQLYSLYFIPLTGTDTIITTFTPTQSPPSLQFTVPSALSKSTVYRTEFWILPGVRSQIAGVQTAGTLLSGSAPGNSGAGTSAGTNAGNLISRNGATEFMQLNATGNNGITLKQAVSADSKRADPIPYYTMYFGTSAFNTLDDKIKSFGSQLTYTITNNYIVINTSAAGAEFFDACELQPYQNLYNKLNGNKTLPPLLGISIPSNYNITNDKTYYSDITKNIQTLTADGFTVDLGNDAIRGADGFPSLALGVSSTDHMLTTADTTRYTGISKAGFISPVTSGLAVAGTSTAPVFPANKIIWSRELYAMNDYTTMRGIGYAYQQANYPIQPSCSIYEGSTGVPGKTVSTPPAPGQITFTPPQFFGTGLGTASIGLYNFCMFNNVDANADMVINFQKLAYQSYPQSGVSREIDFSYSYPGTGKTYKSTMGNAGTIQMQFVAPGVLENK